MIMSMKTVCLLIQLMIAISIDAEKLMFNRFGGKRLLFTTRMAQQQPPVAMLNMVEDTTLQAPSSHFSCSDKEDDKHYEHVDCRKYWHCLYVGSIFQTALERKCPMGTMFHPIFKSCELSTIMNCKLWRKSIMGDDSYMESQTPPAPEYDQFIPTNPTSTATTTTSTSTIKVTTNKIFTIDREKYKDLIKLINIKKNAPTTTKKPAHLVSTTTTTTTSTTTSTPPPSGSDEEIYIEYYDDGENETVTSSPASQNLLTNYVFTITTASVVTNTMSTRPPTQTTQSTTLVTDLNKNLVSKLSFLNSLAQRNASKQVLVYEIDSIKKLFDSIPTSRYGTKRTTTTTTRTTTTMTTRSTTTTSTTTTTTKPITTSTTTTTSTSSAQTTTLVIPSTSSIPDESVVQKKMNISNVSSDYIEGVEFVDDEEESSNEDDDDDEQTEYEEGEEIEIDTTSNHHNTTASTTDQIERMSNFIDSLIINNVNMSSGEKTNESTKRQEKPIIRAKPDRLGSYIQSSPSVPSSPSSLISLNSSSLPNSIYDFHISFSPKLYARNHATTTTTRFYFLVHPHYSLVFGLFYLILFI